MGDVSASSSCSMHTALEFVDPTAFKKKTMSEVITREELRSAISDFKMKEDNYSKQEADLYATVVSVVYSYSAKNIPF